MNDELKIKIQWLPGAVLPVVTHGSSTADELSKLLQFSCFSNEKIVLFHNGEVLKPSVSLQSQGVQKGDVIECKVVSKLNGSKDSSPETESIAREAARVLDMKTNNSKESEFKKSDSNSSYSDSDNYQFLQAEDNDLTHANVISSEPLPIAWQNDVPENITFENKAKLKDQANEKPAKEKSVKEKMTW
ncbi:hypothetical protein GPJ56_001354 [Histomonas meleagridis]|uniref:uncharacterized protein n=1 Tax=Histomonas meleagridis TaxID=135588 RepID=UPI003559C984|nr:hypothetical protein GPJ56_001354 [Histomonas meleagridis]KAH0805110.1 hypothetical protein GO595_002055 [Histomonas meleagridis]